MSNIRDIFNDSCERVLTEKTSQNFFDTFYSKFISKNEVIQKYFEKTDLERQKSMLKRSFYYVLMLYVTKAPSQRMREIAIRHSRTVLNVKPELYDIWLESLLETVDLLDPCFSPEIEQAWRAVFTAGTEYMKSMSDCLEE